MPRDTSPAGSNKEEHLLLLSTLTSVWSFLLERWWREYCYCRLSANLSVVCWGSAERANKTKRETCTTERVVAAHNNNKTVRDGKTCWKTNKENCEGNNGEFYIRRTSALGLVFVDLSDQVFLSSAEQQLSFSIELSRSVQLICCNPSDFLQHSPPTPPADHSADIILRALEMTAVKTDNDAKYAKPDMHTPTHTHPHFHKITHTNP